MKTKKIKYLLLAAPVAAAMLVSCEDAAIEAGNKIDESIYEAIDGNNAFLRDVKTSKTAAVAEFYGDATSYTTSVQAGIQKVAGTTVSGTVSIDEAWLEVYNERNNTKYDLLPADRVTIAGDGAFTVEAGSLYSSQVTVTFTAPATIDESNKTYALPLAINVTGASGVSAEGDNHVVYLVRDMRSLPDCIKLDENGNRLPQAIVMYDGGHNPLSALTFELENGKLLWDIVIPFSSNLEWSQDEGRPYLAHNPELQWAYDNREKVIEPLQQRGIKVILSILNGNGSIAGVAQLSELGAKTFAAEVARFVYANNLDGVFLDDEYEDPPITTYPYLEAKSYRACARLYHELKKAMPDKLMCSYEYSYTHSNSMQNNYSDVVDVSEYIDIVIADYGGKGGPTGRLAIGQCTGLSMELNPNIYRGGNFDTDASDTILNNGYGYWMAFNPHPPYYYSAGTAAAGYPNRGQLDARMPKDAGIKAIYGVNLKDPEFFYNRMDFTPYPMSEIANYK